MSAQDLLTGLLQTAILRVQSAFRTVPANWSDPVAWGAVTAVVAVALALGTAVAAGRLQLKPERRTHVILDVRPSTLTGVVTMSRWR